MGKPPAFQFYANDFIGATITWDAIACGMYIRLLCTQWVNGSIPDDQRRIAKAAGVELGELQREWHLIEPKFPLCSDGTRKNPRLEEVRQRQEELSAKRSEAGRIGANASAHARANASAKAPPKNQQRKVKEKMKKEGEAEGASEAMGQRAHEPEIIPIGVTHKMWEAMKRWETHRQEIGKPIKPSGRDAFIKKCLEWGEARTLAAIDHSIANGYQGCFEPSSTNGQPARQGHQHLTFEERVRAATEFATRHLREPDAGTGH